MLICVNARAVPRFLTWIKGRCAWSRNIVEFFRGSTQREGRRFLEDGFSMLEVTDRPRTEPATEAFSGTLLAVIAELLRESQQGGRARPVHLDSSLERDLGIDSLARVELIVRIERTFNVRLPEDLLGTAETPRDLLRAVLAGGARAPEPVIQVATPIAQAQPGREDLPEGAATLVEVLDWHVAAHPERVHVVILADGEQAEPMSYAELREESGRIAAGLADLGVEPGDAVAIMLALLVLTPWALWEADRLRRSLAHQLRTMALRSRHKRDY